MNPIFNINKNDYFLISFPVGDFASNATIIYNKKTFKGIVFDPGFLKHPVKDFIKQHCLNIEKIIHTHGHFDHIAASPELKRQTNAQLYLHKDDEPLYTSMSAHANLFGLEINTHIEKIDHYLEQDKTYTFETDNDNEPAPSFQCLHTPGHSEGSCCFFCDYFDFPILISGDTLFMNSIGRTDLPGGNYKAIINSIKNKLLPLPDSTKVITGHGPATTIKNEKLHNPFIQR